MVDLEQAALLHVDETPWKESGKALWVFVCTRTTLFLIGSRGMEILENALSSKFVGDLMSDGYQVCRHLGRRLRCWAHLTRKLQGLSESTDAKVAQAGKAMQDVLLTLMEAIYVARTREPEADGALASRYAADIARLRALCERHRDASHKQLREVTREFLIDGG